MTIGDVAGDNVEVGVPDDLPGRGLIVHGDVDATRVRGFNDGLAYMFQLHGYFFEQIVRDLKKIFVMFFGDHQCVAFVDRCDI